MLIQRRSVERQSRNTGGKTQQTGRHKDSPVNYVRRNCDADKRWSSFLQQEGSIGRFHSASDTHFILIEGAATQQVNRGRQRGC